MQYLLMPKSKWKICSKLLKIPKTECPDIWIRLPRHKWPKSWSSMEDPVVPLEQILWQDYYCANFVCVVTRSTTAEFQHNDMIMKTNVQNDLRLEMALEMWIVCAHEKSEQL